MFSRWDAIPSCDDFQTLGTWMEFKEQVAGGNRFCIITKAELRLGAVPIIPVAFLSCRAMANTDLSFKPSRNMATSSAMATLLGDLNLNSSSCSVTSTSLCPPWASLRGKGGNVTRGLLHPPPGSAPRQPGRGHPPELQRKKPSSESRAMAGPGAESRSAPVPGPAVCVGR